MSSKETKIGTLSFSSRDPRFPVMIAEKYDLSTEGLHKLNETDTKQQLSEQRKKVKMANDEGRSLRFLEQPNDKGPVFAVWTNKDLDIFGFYKVVEGGDVVRVVTFGKKAYRLF